MNSNHLLFIKGHKAQKGHNTHQLGKGVEGLPHVIKCAVAMQQSFECSCSDEVIDL